MKTITRNIALSISLILVVLCISASYFFMLSPPYLSHQYLELNKQCTTCTNAEKLAVDHFTKGKYQLIHWGLMDMDSPSLKIAKILQRDFGINTVFGGCISPPALVCYDSKMRELLTGRYGVDFYEFARREASILH